MKSSRPRGTALFSITAVVAAAAVAWLATRPAPRPAQQTKLVKILEIAGQGSIARATGALDEASGGAALSSRDALSLGEGHAILEFRDGTQARLEGPARISVDLDGDLVATLEAGRLKPEGLAPKETKPLRVRRDGVVYSLGDAALFASPGRLVITLDARGAEMAASALDELASDDQERAQAKPPESSAGSLPPAAPPSPPVAEEKAKPRFDLGTSGLSEPDIEAGMATQAGFLKRCALAYFERQRKLGSARSGKASETVLMSFKILPSGRAVDAKGVGGAGDPQLWRCMAEVTERAIFRRFTGKPVLIGEYPIHIE